METYLNVVNGAPVFMVRSRRVVYYDQITARNIGREQAARLAAILPAPLKRGPERMNSYSAIILRRMGPKVMVIAACGPEGTMGEGYCTMPREEVDEGVALLKLD